MVLLNPGKVIVSVLRRRFGVALANLLAIKSGQIPVIKTNPAKMTINSLLSSTSNERRDRDRIDSIQSEITINKSAPRNNDEPTTRNDSLANPSIKFN